MKTQSDAAWIGQEAERAFTDHVMVEEPVRSFRFHGNHTAKAIKHLYEGAYPFAKVVTQQKAAFQYSSHMAFTLTWTPGHIALVGDLGELTLVHYHALRRFDDIGWALSRDHSYLMSKTNVRQVYDADATFAFLMESLNRPVTEALWGSTTPRYERSSGGALVARRRETGLIHELRAWRDDVQSARGEFAQEHAHWAREGRDSAPEPRLEEFLPGNPYDHFERVRFPVLSHAHRPVERVRRSWRIPEYWQGWVDVWAAIEAGSYYDADAPHHGSPESVTIAKTRRALKEEIRARLADRNEAVEFLSEIGFDDYYGSDVWPSQTYWQIAAIQHGVKMILDAQAGAPALMAGAA